MTVADNKHTISFQLPGDLTDRLKRAADERCISRNSLVAHLLEEGLGRLIPVDELRLPR